MSIIEQPHPSTSPNGSKPWWYDETLENSHFVQSQSGAEYAIDDTVYNEFLNHDVDIADFLRYTDMVKTADECRRGLPDMPISDGVVAAMKAKADQVLQALEQAPDNEYDMPSVDEVRRAMRDIYFLYSCLALVTGAHSSHEAIEKNLTFAYPKSHRHLNNGRYESIIKVQNETLLDEGDFVEITGEDRDYDFQEGFAYIGQLRILIDPKKRIEISYTPEQESAQAYHASETVVRNDTQKRYQNTDISMRIDIDHTAPAGVALDLGRSAFEGDKLTRPGDLIGNVFSSVSPHGSHEYTGFTPDMKDQFPQFADEFALQQYLYHKWRDDELKNKISRRLQHAVATRYFEEFPS